MVANEYTASETRFLQETGFLRPWWLCPKKVSGTFRRSKTPAFIGLESSRHLFWAYGQRDLLCAVLSLSSKGRVFAWEASVRTHDAKTRQGQSVSGNPLASHLAARSLW